MSPGSGAGEGDAETICAIASVAGDGGVGLVRVSGARAFAIVDRLFRGRRELNAAPTHTVHYGHLEDGRGRRIDEVLATVLRAPRSYTREDMVEIGAHGSRVVLRAILEALIGAGARLAQPGEFTKRAFLNGRIDLTRAEAVMELIHARTEAGARAAMVRLQGGLGERLGAWRDRLITVTAQIEAAIDFSDEGLEFIPRRELSEQLAQITTEMTDMIQRAETGRLLQDGVRTVIIGRPNVGKSSLLNRLLETERAIVTPIPGTTRDTLEEYFSLDGVPLRLIDTAGLHDSDDPIEREGMRRTREALARAELRLIVLEAGAEVTPQERDWLSDDCRRTIVVINKVDRNPVEPPTGQLPTGVSIVPVSALKGTGLDALRGAMRAALGRTGELLEGVFVASTRQQEGLSAAEEHLRSALASLTAGMTDEVIAMDLRAAVDRLGELLGLTVTDEILDRVFRDFCIGK